VPTLSAWLKATGRVVEEPQPGDLVLFDWDGGELDHAGLVLRATPDRLHTVEGNARDQVLRGTRSRAVAALFGRVT